MCKTIKQKVKFRAAPEVVYQFLTDSKRYASLTGEKASLGRKIGDAFSTRAGRVNGVVVDLEPGKRVVQAWRRKDFPVGAFSMAAFVLTATRDGGTELVLTHRGVPKLLIPDVERDWRECHWEALKRQLQGTRPEP